MGIHFDGLVELLNKGHITKEKVKKITPDLHTWLSNVVEQAALINFPMNAEEIFKDADKETVDLDKYYMDYFDLSRQNDRFMITPYDTTAIEDPSQCLSLLNPVVASALDIQNEYEKAFDERNESDN